MSIAEEPAFTAVTAAAGDPADAGTAGPRGWWRSLWSGISAVVGAVIGLLPHVLHHIGLFAGAFVIAGVAGNLAFAALGLALSLPMLRRLYRRFGNWKAPATAVAVFAVMFSLSAFVLGPALTSPGAETSTDAPAQGPDQGPVPSMPTDHAAHHGG